MGPDGKPVDPSAHGNTDAVPACFGEDVTSGTDFCSGSTGTTMYMTGFISYLTGEYRTPGGETKPECINLWFESWTLDSQVKFFFGCIGVILLALATEGMGCVRRIAKWNLKQHQSLSEESKGVIMTVLYAVQIFMGYLCMLVAMTYQSELFVCLIFGLALGHFVFNLESLREAKGAPDPCCPDIDVDEVDGKVTHDSESGRETGKVKRRGQNYYNAIGNSKQKGILEPFVENSISNKM